MIKTSNFVHCPNEILDIIKHDDLLPKKSDWVKTEKELPLAYGYGSLYVYKCPHCGEEIFVDFYYSPTYVKDNFCHSCSHPMNGIVNN